MEARETQSGLVQRVALDGDMLAKPSTSEHSANASVEEQGNKPFLDLSVREKLQTRSTSTSLASLVCPTDELDEDNIEPVAKESQVKDQPNNFGDVFVYPYPCSDMSKHPPQKKRRH